MTATIKLWEVGDLYTDLIERIVEGGGELTPELEAELDAADQLFTRKGEAVALYIQNLQATAAAAQHEADRLKALATTRARTADSLKNYLKVQMERIGTKAVETDRIKLRIQRNSVPSVSVSSPSLEVGEEVPVRYQHIKITLDKKQVVDDWKAGTPLPEGITVEVGAHLRIS